MHMVVAAGTTTPMPKVERKSEKVKEIVKKIVKKIPKAKKRRPTRSDMGRVKLVAQYAADVNKQCAFQALNADAAVMAGDFVDAPVSDGSPVHLFSTTTEVTVNSVNRTDGTVAYILVEGRAAPQQHIRYATAFGNDGGWTTVSTQDVEGYSSLATIYDDLRCCAMCMVVKDASIEEKRNGVIKVLNYNPVTTITTARADAVEGFEFPPDKMHYARLPWMPARPEVDHAFMSPTATPSTESTFMVCRGTFAPTASGPITLRVVVYAIWAGRLNPDMDHVAIPKFYAIDQREVEQHLQAMLLPPTYLYSKQRIMTSDDGPIESVLADGKIGWEGAKKLFGSGVSLGDRLSGGMDLVSSIGNIGSTIASWFGDEERAVLRLAGLSQRQLDFLRVVLTTSPRSQSGPATPERITTLLERYRMRRHITGRPRSKRAFPVLFDGVHFKSDDLSRFRNGAVFMSNGEPLDAWLDDDPYVARFLPWDYTSDAAAWELLPPRSVASAGPPCPPPRR